MRARLEALGVRGVRARTFHSSALAQLHHLVPGTGEILPSKALWLRQIANGLPDAYRFRPAADLATEIEWAKNRRLTPATYPDGLDGHEPPIPLDLMLRVFRRYEERKQREGRIDFEDVLELLVRFYELTPTRPSVSGLAARRSPSMSTRTSTCSSRRCSTTGSATATSSARWATITRRSTRSPGRRRTISWSCRRGSRTRPWCGSRRTTGRRRRCLRLANRLVPALGGARKELRPIAGDGPEPVLQVSDDEGGWIAQRIAELHRDQRVAL